MLSADRVVFLQVSSVMIVSTTTFVGMRCNQTVTTVANVSNADDRTPIEEQTPKVCVTCTPPGYEKEEEEKNLQ